MSQLPTIPTNNLSVEHIITVWLQSKAGRSQSKMTERSYRETITKFREALQQVGLDLNSNQPKLIRMAAQGWAAQRHTQEMNDAPVSNNTFNLRLAIISSFYEFAYKQEHLPFSNPLTIIERRPVQAYAGARSMDPDEVAQHLAKINRRDPQGARDFALLSIAFATGRRVSELSGMRAGHLKFINKQKVIITWPHCKGGKVMYDDVEGPVARALIAYLKMCYGKVEGLPTDTPIWIAFSRNEFKGGAISNQAISDIFKKHLDTSKVHISRHTFSREMLKVGATEMEISKHLGHANLSTTHTYLVETGGSENPHAAALAKRFGITDEEETID